jgi:hypothetical protein
MKTAARAPAPGLSTRAMGVLEEIVCADHLASTGKALEVGALTTTELLRRATRIDPPLTYYTLQRRFRGCGKKTAVEVAQALGLPLPPPHPAQCPRCGHVFGGNV